MFYELLQRGILYKKRKAHGRRPDQNMSDALTDVRERGDVPWEWTYASRVRFERIRSCTRVARAEMNTKIGKNRRLLVCGSRAVRNGLKTAPWDLNHGATF